MRGRLLSTSYPSVMLSMARLLVCLAAMLGATSHAQSTSAPTAVLEQLPKKTTTYHVQRGVRIAMRDGTRLSADIYMPAGVETPLPTVLVRTPYGKDEAFSSRAADLFATRGYVVIAQDKRGRFESEGEYTIGDHEVVDSFDTIEWIAQQPWSNKKVGAYGCSDRGDAALYAAVSRHPALRAIIPEAAGSAVGKVGGWYGYFGGRNGGAVELAMGLGWFVDNGTKAMLRPPSQLTWEQFIAIRPGYKLDLTPPDIDYDQAVWSLPLADIMRLHGLPLTDWENLAARELADPFFDRLDFLRGNERIGVPALHVNSWYDFGVAQTFIERDLFVRNADTALARDHQFALISPTLHCRSTRMTDNYVVGARRMGDPRFPIEATYLRWFDHWLKGVENRVTEMPKIQYFLMGGNEWRSASAWPPTDSRKTQFFFGGTGSANGPLSAGVLSTKRARDWIELDRYVYDPANPVRSIGGSLCCIRGDRLEGSFDQREAELREDVLTFTTSPLVKGISVVGPVNVVLFVMSSARDTDFTAKLIDVYPDGNAYNIGEGILRARYRNGFEAPALMEEGQVYELKIRMPDTANHFAAGHRMRLEISSSNFPRFDRNLNTGGRNYDETQWVTARNTILRDVAHPSHLEVYELPGR